MAQISSTPSSDTPSAASPGRPYAPSWFDRFTHWVDHLPFPAPIFYIGFALVLAIGQILMMWNGADGVIYGFPIFYVVTLPYLLALMHYLDDVAANALARIRPLLTVSDAEYDDLLYRLTTLPNRPVWIAGFVGALNGIMMMIVIPFSVQVNELHFAATPISMLFIRLYTPFFGYILGVMVYHAIHQLNVVRQLYDRSIRIDLFMLRPLYAFSALSGLTVVGFGFVNSLWFILTPSLLLMNLLFFIVFIGVALLTFVLPMRGAHRLLEQEKERLLVENGERQRAMIAQLHRRIDTDDLAEMDNLNKTLTSLELERAALERISTWPWNPETPRAVVAALLFPVVVWLLQRVLERVLA